MERLQERALPAGAADELVEVDVGQARAEAGVVAEVRPQDDLAVDAHEEEVELLEAAERGVARQATVELQAPEALAGDRQQRLDVRPWNLQARHDPLDRLEVLADRRRDP